MPRYSMGVVVPDPCLGTKEPRGPFLWDTLLGNYIFD
jgi:hypothetical protein